MSELLSHPTQWIATPLTLVLGVVLLVLVVKNRRETWR